VRFDIFFSICQTEVDGFLPSEKFMWRNFFDQVGTADELGYGTAWVAETHLSCQIQKRNPGAVIPHFKGEIGLNTDILQVAHKIFSQTKNLRVGSAIRNIQCNGGPMAHAEAIRTFLSLHGLDEDESRGLDIGFASGRFPFSNVPYGIRPRNELEKIAWPALRGLVFLEATEIFLRFLRGDIFASKDVAAIKLNRALFRNDQDWENVVRAAHSAGQEAGSGGEIEIPPYWVFDEVGVIPFDAPMELLSLTIGAHDALSQNFANTILPVGVFNLSITPTEVIEETHTRMKTKFHPKGGPWNRSHMPRTVLVFIDEDEKKAHARAQSALKTYWQAMEGTLDPKKVEQASENALIGTPQQILEQVKARFHGDDRLMLWFDLSNHDNESVKESMRLFMEKVAAKI
jgi:hypothetical protein